MRARKYVAVIQTRVHGVVGERGESMSATLAGLDCDSGCSFKLVDVGDNFLLYFMSRLSRCGSFVTCADAVAVCQAVVLLAEAEDLRQLFIQVHGVLHRLVEYSLYT